jgi:aspartate aminotransferase
MSERREPLTQLPLAQRLSLIAPSATSEMFRRVAELTAAGVPLVSLAIGEPDFTPPVEILKAAQRALDTGPYGYTQVSGLPTLRAAICARSSARRSQVHRPNEVVVTVGAKHALFQLAQALFDPGDEILIPTPSWVSYADQARLCGAKPVFLPCAESDGFLPTPAAITAAVNSRTKAIVLCSPNNPTGAAFDEAALLQLAAALRGHSFWIILDEIYAELAYAAAGAPSLLTVAPDLRDRIIVVDGVSKSYAMTGFRVGWILAPERVAKACEMLQSQSTTNIATIAQLAATAALTGDQTCVATMRAAYRERRDRFVTALRAIPGLKCSMPLGAFYVFADVRGWYGRRSGERVLTDDTAVAEWLLDDARVASVPGSAFGGPGYLRFSYATSQAQLDEAVTRITAAVARLR